jgi:uncharacterized lipoprotein YmbA
MKFTNQRSWLALFLVATVLAGCASTPPPTLLALAPIEAAKPATTPLASPPNLLAVRRPQVPEYLLAQRVRYRSGDSTLAEWPNTYWAERLEISVARGFEDALRQRLPGWQICEVNCSERSPTLALQVRLTRMDYVRNEQKLVGGAQLSLWSTEKPPRLLHTEEHAYSIDGDADTPQSHARTVSAFLDRVAADAALAVNVDPQRRLGIQRLR